MKQKIIIFTFVFLPQILFSQEISSHTDKNTYQYTPHSIGISTRFGVANRNNINQHSNIFLSTTTIDFYLGKRLGKTQYIPFLLQLRFSSPPLKDYTTYFPVYEEFRWGVLLGASQYAFDFRSKTTGIGWAMLINGGLAIDFPALSRIDFLSSFMILGIELDAKTIYNFNKHIGITFGTSFGYHISYSYRNNAVVDSEGFAIPLPRGLYIDNIIIYSLNIGLIF